MLLSHGRLADPIFLSYVPLWYSIKYYIVRRVVDLYFLYTWQGRPLFGPSTKRRSAAQRAGKS